MTWILLGAVVLLVWLWVRAERKREQAETALAESASRLTLALARRVIALHLPAALESSHFWPYEDVVEAAFGKVSKEDGSP